MESEGEYCRKYKTELENTGLNIKTHAHTSTVHFVASPPVSKVKAWPRDNNVTDKIDTEMPILFFPIPFNSCWGALKNGLSIIGRYCNFTYAYMH